MCAGKSGDGFRYCEEMYRSGQLTHSVQWQQFALATAEVWLHGSFISEVTCLFLYCTGLLRDYPSLWCVTSSVGVLYVRMYMCVGADDGVEALTVLITVLELMAALFHLLARPNSGKLKESAVLLLK